MAKALNVPTRIERVSVEIEGRSYPVAPKTVGLARSLIRERRRLSRKPEYRLWRAELRLLLGRRAMGRLFPGGRRENLDRMQRIHAGVLRAFEHNAQTLQSEELINALLQGEDAENLLL